MYKIIGFAPALLKVALECSLDVSVRQAAALYFKNNISEWWRDPDPEKPGEALTFSIHEQDRHTIRNAIIGAVVSSPLPLQTQLKTALSKIIKADYPSRFPELPAQLRHLLSSTDQEHWRGALVCLHTFVKVYEYRRNDDRNNIIAIMREFLPILQNAMVNLISNKAEDSLALQLIILKIFFAFINFHFPLDAMEKEVV
ncbi:unnamed protein product [Dicrocoelium dendriticum]|nr:unnamed protein product [Dicrocoelium dendriticum]